MFTKLTVVVTDAKAIEVLRLIDKFGEVDVSPVEIIPFEKNKPRVKRGPDKKPRKVKGSPHKGHIKVARELVANLKDEFTAKDFIEAMAKLNITPAAPYQMLGKMVEENLVKKIGPARYVPVPADQRVH